MDPPTMIRLVLDLIPVSKVESLLQWQVAHGLVLFYLASYQINWAGKAPFKSVQSSGVLAVSLSVPVRT
jgi:hypothetical protein